MKGLRKFVITLVALIVYGVIMVVVPQTNPAQLGFGIGFLIAPTAVANIFEWVNLKGK